MYYQTASHQVRKVLMQVVILMVITCTAHISNAQIGTYKRLEIGGALGLTQNTGDVNNAPALGNTRFCGEGFFKYNFTTYFAGRAFIAMGALAGSGKNTDIPNTQEAYSFKSRYVNFGGIFEYNFFNFRGVRESYKFSPYLFAGIGVTNITNKRYMSDQLLTSEGSGISPMIPFGIGVKKGLGRRFNMAVEFQTVKLFTDGVDGLYTNPDTGVNFPAFIGVNAKNDIYYQLTFSVAYRFITIKCPESSLDYAGDR